MQSKRTKVKSTFQCQLRVPLRAAVESVFDLSGRLLSPRNPAKWCVGNPELRRRCCDEPPLLSTDDRRR